MDQDATWYEGRHRHRRHCVRWGPSFPQFSANIYCGQTVAHLSNCWAVVCSVNLLCKGRHGSFHMWINIRAAGKTKWSLVNTCQPEHFGDEYRKAAYKCTAYFTYFTSLHWSQPGQIIHCPQSFFFVEHRTSEARRVPFFAMLADCIETVISSVYYVTK